MVFEVEWPIFVTWLQRGRGHTDNLQRMKPVIWKEDENTITLYYDYLGTMFRSIIVKDDISEEELRRFVENYLKPVESVRIIGEV